MAPKKQTPHNAFFHFMTSFDSDYRRCGRSYPGGYKAIAEKLSSTWQAMSAEERKPYEDMAIHEKGRQKLTTHGQTYEEVEEEKKSLEEKHELMLSTIQSTLTNLGRDTGMAYEPFFLLHMNYFCKTGDGVFFPAEIALAAFSIKLGMQEPYHTLVNPGPLPTGYAFKAKQHSDETHRIDLTKRLGESSQESIALALEQYVCRHRDHRGAMPPFYTTEKFVPSAEEMLTRWAKTFGKPAGFYRVYPLEELFYALRQAAMKPEGQRPVVDGKPDPGFVFSSTAGKKLNDDPYSYRPRIACSLHEELDVVQHCSRSYVTRWGWVMCDFLCSDMDVQMLPGRHCPHDGVVRPLPATATAAAPIEAKLAALQSAYPAAYLPRGLGRGVSDWPGVGRGAPANGSGGSANGSGGSGNGSGGSGWSTAGRGGHATADGAVPRAAGRGHVAIRYPGNPWGSVPSGPVPSGPVPSGPVPAPFEDDDADSFPALAPGRRRQPARPLRQPRQPSQTGGNVVTCPAFLLNMGNPDAKN